MVSRLFSLQQRIGYALLGMLEQEEISVGVAADISRKVLEIIPEDEDEANFVEIVRQINMIQELKGLEFGL